MRKGKDGLQKSTNDPNFSLLKKRTEAYLEGSWSRARVDEVANNHVKVSEEHKPNLHFGEFQKEGDWYIHRRRWSYKCPQVYRAPELICDVHEVDQ